MELPWHIVQQVKAAYFKNMPDDSSCVFRVSLLPGEDRDGLHASHPMPGIRMLWKKPNRIKLAFIESDPRGKSYFEERLEGFFTRVRKVKTIGEVNLNLFDIIFAVLEGDLNAKILGVEKVVGRDATLVHFPSVFAPLPMGAVGNGLKLWVDKEKGLPVQVRFFTNRAVLTFTIEYAAQTDRGGRKYDLPVKIVLTPDLTEENRSAAFPITITMSDYAINTGLADAEFE